MADNITPNDTVETPRVTIRRLLDRFDGCAGLAGMRVRVVGRVKAGIEKGKGKFALLELNDGSCPANLQVIVDAAVADLSPLVATGTFVVVEGLLKETTEGTEQKIELRAEQVIRGGTYLRAPAVLIPAVARIRNALALATHTFFQEHGLLYVHTPVITTSDCEGAGGMLLATTLTSDAQKLEELIKNLPPSEAAKVLVKVKAAAHPFFQEHGFLYGHTPFITTIDCEGAGGMFQATTLTSDAQKLEELIKNLPPSEAAKFLVKVKAAAHPFFQEHGFLYGHTPFITTSDCEGAGEMFQATTLISDAQKLEELIKNLRPSEAAKVLFKVRIAMVGKYTGLSDSYLSVLKKRIMEGWEVSTGQSREDQMHVSKKFKEIECQCAQLREETNLISQQIKGTKLRLRLLSKISKAREHEDFVKARKLTIRLRKLIASQNEEERAIKMTATSTKD